ncbi:cytochrome P450 [Dictyobacter aurantiacus]|uniref:Putative cytochrome P450 YjiB n=1 Tax=Dictyobacter aurantiacus TaxID=1936993 RepID=A0A401ZQ13_9CHLR|nr:cytochrome P450 [Dictyobacter aurantiacus]GCE08957.1 putative cytochrome P450 YjiB [Dictyobacter aurantiacus]
MMIPTLSTVEDSQKMYQWFEQMRQTLPVWLDEESKCWHVFRYDDVNTVITDYQRFSSERRIQREVIAATAHSNNERPPRTGRSIIAMDPPQHRQYRNLVTSAFTPRAIDKLRGRVAQITQELLDKAAAGGGMDFANDIAYPLPTIVIAEMLGVPVSDRPLFQTWADGLLRRQLSDAEVFRSAEEQRNNPELQRLGRVFEEMSDYFERMLEERKREPRDDMMSALLQAEVDGQHLSMDDTISFCTLLLLAGHVTTTNLLGQAIRCFDEHPDALAQLYKEPELIPSAVEEVLRYASPVWRLIRTTKEEVTLSGITIPKDAAVFAWLASANRDPQQFTAPERFDITRTPNKHVAFGHGIHFCIGAPLSRMEAAVALPIILKQLPNLHVDWSGAQLFEGRFLFGFKHLPITFDMQRTKTA